MENNMEGCYYKNLPNTIIITLSLDANKRKLSTMGAMIVASVFFLQFCMNGLVGGIGVTDNAEATKPGLFQLYEGESNFVPIPNPQYTQLLHSAPNYITKPIVGNYQLLPIEKQDFHDDVVLYDVDYNSKFQKIPSDDEDYEEPETYAAKYGFSGGKKKEVHYHKHKHVHEHNHKQEHVHKHKQEHHHDHKHGHKQDSKHVHEHKGEHHHGHHEVAHHSHHDQHKHSHHGDHKHEHKAEHHHGHHHGHKHEHKQDHKHEHKHHGDHHHDHHQGHEHKHSHDHKHDNKHHHSHHGKHHHNHHHKHGHHGHHDHKHGHHHGHHHKHHKH